MTCDAGKGPTAEREDTMRAYGRFNHHMKRLLLTVGAVAALGCVPAAAQANVADVDASCTHTDVSFTQLGSGQHPYQVLIDGNVVNSGTINGSSGSASFDNPFLAQGDHPVVAQYKDKSYSPWKTIGTGTASCDYTGPQGPAGPQGPQGPTGPTGPAGPTGPTGPAGPQGPQGEQGPAGSNGTDGTDGTDGTNGSAGSTGAQGQQGISGMPGANGQDGAPGADGLTTVVTVTKVQQQAPACGLSHRRISFTLPKEYAGQKRIRALVGGKAQRVNIGRHRHVVLRLDGRQPGQYAVVIKGRGSLPTVVREYSWCSGNLTGINAS